MTAEYVVPTSLNFLCKPAPPRKLVRGDIIMPSSLHGKRGKMSAGQHEVIVVSEPPHWPKAAEETYGPKPCTVGDRLIVTGVMGPFIVNYETCCIVHIDDIVGIVKNADLQGAIRPLG